MVQTCYCVVQRECATILPGPRTQVTGGQAVRGHGLIEEWRSWRRRHKFPIPQTILAGVKRYGREKRVVLDGIVPPIGFGGQVYTIIANITVLWWWRQGGRITRCTARWIVDSGKHIGSVCFTAVYGSFGSLQKRMNKSIKS
jgi:hypothetical protein